MPADGQRLIEPADYERFVAFAFAAADVVVELGQDRTLVYAAGSFRADLGREPDEFLGRPVTDLVAPIDHELLQASLAILQGCDRLPRCVVHLANSKRTSVALSGLALRAPDRPPRLCLTFSLIAEPEADGACPATLRRRAETCLRARSGCLDLFEIVLENGAGASLDSAVGAALRSALPNALASDLARGRIGVLDDAARGQPDQLVASLTRTLRESGVKASIVSHHLALSDHGLTPVQAARALRHAIGVFARDGAVGLRRSGLDHGLDGYLVQASAQATGLRRGIREESFDLLFQPIVSLRERRVERYEALIRPHRHALGSARSTQDFVMMVEAVGLAEELDLAVARRVCEAASVSGHGIALNLSSQSVQSVAFRRELLAVLEHSRAAERRISVEMTETAEIDDLDEAARTAEALHRIGVAFAIDDFGAGTAGVDVLRTLKPEIVKLDGSYTQNLSRSARDRALFSAMADLVRATGAKLVAERVETDREASELLRLGVEFGQGWLFGRAAPLPLSTNAAPARLGPARPRGEREVWGR